MFNGPHRIPLRAVISSFLLAGEDRNELALIVFEI